MLWLRNNGSTLLSQLVDSIAVILITFAVGGLSGAIRPDIPLALQLIVLVLTSYTFKLAVGPDRHDPVYIGVHYLKKYLQYDPLQEHSE